jgi:hypothetical protein
MMGHVSRQLFRIVTLAKRQRSFWTVAMIEAGGENDGGLR